MRTINRSYTPRTTRLLSEWLAMQYPHALIIQEFHLTEANPSAVAAAGGKVSRRFGGRILGYPDAAVVLPGRILLWECKDSLTPQAIGQIESYGHLYAQSVEASEHQGVAVELHLLVARATQPMLDLAASHGIIVTIYDPAWYGESKLRAANVAVVRAQEATGRAVVASALAGKLTDEEALSHLEGAGFTIDSAKLMLAEARDRVADAASGESATEDA